MSNKIVVINQPLDIVLYCSAVDTVEFTEKTDTHIRWGTTTTYKNPRVRVSNPENVCVIRNIGKDKDDGEED